LAHDAGSTAPEFAPDQQARDRAAGNSASPDTGPAAFEFLHNTFGEFLAADFILRRALAEADAVCALSGNAVLADTLRQRLTTVSPSWFACLMHTPLHTRPNILALMREWGGHRLSQGTRTRQDLLKALDTIILVQLRALLGQTPLSDLSARESVPAGESGVGEKSPYDPLPALGHLAIYSLNLVLLRCYLTDGTYVLDEDDLGGRQTDGGRGTVWSTSGAPGSRLEASARLLLCSPRPATRPGLRSSQRPPRWPYRTPRVCTPLTTWPSHSPMT
jgi:hypothetical protein